MLVCHINQTKRKYVNMPGNQASKFENKFRI